MESIHINVMGAREAVSFIEKVTESLAQNFYYPLSTLMSISIL